jgi:hypothetical protein
VPALSRLPGPLFKNGRDAFHCVPFIPAKARHPVERLLLQIRDACRLRVQGGVLPALSFGLRFTCGSRHAPRIISAFCFQLSAFARRWLWAALPRLSSFILHPSSFTLGWPWGSLGVALGWLWGAYQLAINTLWGGFDMALGGFALPLGVGSWMSDVGCSVRSSSVRPAGVRVAAAGNLPFSIRTDALRRRSGLGCPGILAPDPPSIVRSPGR